ncbi:MULTISPECIES: Asp23/Gls24 family envelope stress response protein [Bacillota]|uniref:Asp23/Gls24 family envelope stress response protein n=2 Tax=Amedibacillus TaxID=2749846 RepID=A0A7G9GMI9_9FIRM|nr:MULTISPECIES: Asp23/Gls24 family envelope stress response protein [Bacillota]QNM12021.1 Asp23/Gls24 family envelope stress response protein [[Eubacterium] hominis]MCH4286629.1 Asp23/Gls24 family envelope stress response protein [Amedibacillus hominis]RGB53088.1 Asp23/Gls24 family envelope stress response protein [Absiella sp. AM22-9]RGB59379.1 Asp23/Gls24 family envelope stress response protein [Absiella sp. AM10-20]RGB66650.1 Asp23/Gls24 family envelope stress response protein [Absiella sp
MAQEYIALKENNDVGVIALSTAAFQAIAKNVIDEEENLKLAAGSKPFKYPLSCKIVNDQLILNLDVKVKYSVNVNDTCSKVQGKIFENIEHMTGYTPDVIDIRVVGFIF